VRAALVIARNELYLVYLDRRALFFILVLPVVIMVVIGSTFFGLEDELHIGVIDHDRSELSSRVQRGLDGSAALETVSYTDADALARDVRTGRMQAGMVVPAGFEASALEGSSGRVELVTDNVRRSTGAVRNIVSGVLTDEGARLSAALVATELAGGDFPTNLVRAGELAEQQDRVEVAEETVGGRIGEPVNRFSYTAPANLVLFVFVNSLAIAASLVLARQLGVVDRMRAGPVRTSAILFGFGLSRVVFSLVQSALLLGVGAVVFGVDFGEPLGVALLVTAFSLMCAGAGLLVGSLVRNGEQAQAIGIPVAISLGMLGGAMWPLEIVGSFMRTLGHAVPHAWAMDAWVELVSEGESARGVLGEVAVLLAFAVVFLAIGTRLLHRKLTAT
jgi:ABC-2 type transport system permease protein